MIELGDKAKDEVSGFTGIVTAIAKYLNKCTRVEISPTKTKDGVPLDSYWFDEEQVSLVKKTVFKSKKKVQTGGPNRSVALRSIPKR